MTNFDTRQTRRDGIVSPRVLAHWTASIWQKIGGGISPPADHCPCPLPR